MASSLLAQRAPSPSPSLDVAAVRLTPARVPLKRSALKRAATVPRAPLTATGLYGNLSLVLSPDTQTPLTRPPPPKRLSVGAQVPRGDVGAGAVRVPRVLLRDLALDKALPSEEAVGRVTRRGNLVWTAPQVRTQLRAREAQRTHEGLAALNASAGRETLTQRPATDGAEKR